MKLSKGETNFWMIGFFIVLIAAAFYIGKNYLNFFPKTSQPEPTVNVQEPTVEVSPSPIITVILLPTIPQKSDLDGIKEAFAKKYNKTIDQVDVLISKKDDTHASGSVKFSGEIAGGWFLAYKEDSGWIIVQDGNGTISCEITAPYNFSSVMIPECIDKNGKLIKK